MENITLNDFAKFNGGWSLSPYTIYLAMKHVNFKNKINILEFGSGEGTKNLVDFLQSKNINFDYLSIEHDKNYAKNEFVKYFLYDLNYSYSPEDIEKVDLTLEGIYDLVIVDGPHGVGRSKWYEKIKNHVKSGSIILIDDFHHYTEFETELNKVFEYDTINVFNIDERFTNNIVNEGIDIVDINSPYHYRKTHKVIKIK